MCFYFLENKSHTLLSAFFLTSSTVVYSFLDLVLFYKANQNSLKTIQNTLSLEKKVY